MTTLPTTARLHAEQAIRLAYKATRHAADSLLTDEHHCEAAAYRNAAIELGLAYLQVTDDEHTNAKNTVAAVHAACAIHSPVQSAPERAAILAMRDAVRTLTTAAAVSNRGA